MPKEDISARLVNEELVQEAVTYINDKANETVYKGYEEIGSYLLLKFFDNDIRVASSRNPHKTASYTALCKREDLVVHPATLSVMVRVAAQERFFDELQFNTEALTHSHKAELVKLPDGETKLALAAEAIESGYSVRELQDQVRKTKAVLREDFKNSTFMPVYIERCISNPLLLFGDPDRTQFLADPGNLRRMRHETRQKLYSKTVGMIEQTKEWTKKYQSLKKQLEQIDRGKAIED